MHARTQARTHARYPEGPCSALSFSSHEVIKTEVLTDGGQRSPSCYLKYHVPLVTHATLNSREQAPVP